MIASEVIAKLQALVETHGDLAVHVNESSDYGEHYPTDGPEFIPAVHEAYEHWHKPAHFYMP